MIINRGFTITEAEGWRVTFTGNNVSTISPVIRELQGMMKGAQDFFKQDESKFGFKTLDVTNSCDIGPTEEETINWTNNVVSSSEAYTTNNLYHNVLDERKLAFKWVVAYNPYFYWKVVSHETGIHKRIGAEWHWKDLQHNNFSVDNKPSVIDVTVTQNGEAIPTIGLYYAGIFVKCNVDARVVSKFIPIGALAKDYEKYSPLFFSNTP